MFPDSPLWVSERSPQAGVQVYLYTVLYNSSDTELTGSLRFLIDDKTLSSQEIQLAAGNSHIFSAGWTSESGPHSAKARFTPLDEALSSQETIAVSLSVVEPPSPTAEALYTARDTGTELLASTVPFVQKTANALFDASESARLAGIEYLEERAGKTLGASTNNAEKSNVDGFTSPDSDTKVSALDRASQVALTAALFTLKNRWFYYSLIVITLYLLFRFARHWVNRPRF